MVFIFGRETLGRGGAASNMLVRTRGLHRWACPGPQARQLFTRTKRGAKNLVHSYHQSGVDTTRHGPGPILGENPASLSHCVTPPGAGHTGGTRSGKMGVAT